METPSGWHLHHEPRQDLGQAHARRAHSRRDREPRRCCGAVLQALRPARGAQVRPVHRRQGDRRPPHSRYLHEPDHGGLPRAPRARAHRSPHRSPAHRGDRVREPPHHRVLRHRLPPQARRRRHPRQQQGEALNRMPLLPPRAHGAPDARYHLPSQPLGRHGRPLLLPRPRGARGQARGAGGCRRRGGARLRCLWVCRARRRGRRGALGRASGGADWRLRRRSRRGPVERCSRRRRLGCGRGPRGRARLWFGLRRRSRRLLSEGVIAGRG